jgi:hypothetical protein
MYGAVTQIKLNNFMEGNSIDTPERKRELKTSWARAAEVFQGVVAAEAGVPDTITTRPIAVGSESFLAELQENPGFLNSFSNYPLSFEEVEIDKLVASQRSVHIDWVDHLCTSFRPDDLLNFCLHPGQDTTALNIGRTAQNAFTASSENPQLRHLGVYDQPYQAELMGAHHPGAQPVHAVVILLGYGNSTVNVYRVGRRLILNNGFHRLYALRKLGFTYVPAVIQQITHPQLELPQVIAELPREYLVETPRPALMRDFFDDRLTCEIHQRSFLKSLQVVFGVTENYVPT